MNVDLRLRVHLLSTSKGGPEKAIGPGVIKLSLRFPGSPMFDARAKLDVAFEPGEDRDLAFEFLSPGDARPYVSRDQTCELVYGHVIGTAPVLELFGD